MTGLRSLTRRNVKLFFKDKGLFFTSLITPLILLVLYGTFLSNVYEETFRSALELLLLIWLLLGLFRLLLKLHRFSILVFVTI